MDARFRRFAVLLLALAVGVLLLESAAWACPSCKESLGHSDPARANVVRGYFWSILFMMSMPFVILGSLGALFWWEVRKANAQKLQAAQAQLAAQREPAEPVEV